MLGSNEPISGPKILQFLARFPTILLLDREYLRIGTRYRQSEKGVAIEEHVYLTCWTFVHKRRKIVPYIGPIYNQYFRRNCHFFAVCGPKFTKLSRHVGECSWITTPFSDWWYLVPIRRYSRSSCDVIWNRTKIDIFGPPIYGGKENPKFLAQFYKLQSPSNMWQNLVTISQGTSEIRWRKQIYILEPS